MKKHIKKLFFLLIGVLLLPKGDSIWVISKSASGTASYDYGKIEGPVAYISSNPSTKYTSIEKALEVAGSNETADTIYVIPGTNPIIKRNATIHSKDTLIIPYGTDTNPEEYNVHDGKQSSAFADGTASNLKNTVTIQKKLY